MGDPSVPSQRRLRAIIHGSVQGVGFRYFTVRWASANGISGWIRNCPDGTVEVLGEGSEAALAEWLARLRIGPQTASVADIQPTWAPATGEFTSFEVRRD